MLQLTLRCSAVAHHSLAYVADCKVADLMRTYAVIICPSLWYHHTSHSAIPEAKLEQLLAGLPDSPALQREKCLAKCGLHH
jgi:hypothetical protein